MRTRTRTRTAAAHATEAPSTPGRAPSPAERAEMESLGVSIDRPAMTLPRPGRGRPAVPRTAVRAPDVLNEATDYRPLPVSFSRGLRVPLGNGLALLLLSGTASVDETGATVHAGDFRAQCWRTFRNLTSLLASEGATWHDVVRTTCYIRDIERDYVDFNEVRTWYYRALGLDPVPASTGIQARICRSDLLVEIEAMALVREEGAVREGRRGRRP
jgi:2-iminobutanoate/2-iminopropanoate deaminase